MVTAGTTSRTGLRLRVERLRRGWSQSQLAEISGIRQPQLSAYEKGRIFPDNRTIARLAEVFAVPEDVIYRWLREPVAEAEVA